MSLNLDDLARRTATKSMIHRMFNGESFAYARLIKIGEIQRDKTMIKSSRWWFAAVMMWVLPALASDYSSTADISALGIKNLKQPSVQTWVAGQPTKAQIEKLGKTGVTHVINLRPASETDWQEDALLEAQGIVFHRLPISGAQDLSFENAAKLDQLLSDLNGESVLVHCASGNRVGGLVALHSIASGASEDAAIEKGKAWGLTRLEKRVRLIAATHDSNETCERETC